MFVVATQFRLIDAATPTPPFLSLPAWLDDSSPALPVPLSLSLAVGSVPALPLVFGLLSTWPCFLSSALSPLSSAPLAVAFAWASLAVADSAVMSTDAPVTSRPTSASVFQSMMMLSAMLAPIAVLPAASAFASVEKSASWLACTVIAPVAVSPLPELPSRAVTWSPLSRSSATLGATDVSPCAPPSAFVSTSRERSASTVTLAPPVSTEVFSTSARVLESSRMFSATAAPTPTLSASSTFEVASEVSSSRLCALSVTSAVEAVTCAPVPTSASVVVVTMFSATAPAIPVLALPAPASAIASISCSETRKSWSAEGEAGRSTPPVIDTA